LKKSIYLFVYLCLIATSYSFAQQIAVKLGNTNILEDEYFTISLIINNGKLSTYSNFPDIAGFAKYTTISNASTTGEKLVKPLIITQQYTPLKPGKFKINDFSMSVNGVILPIKGSNIVVTEIPKTAAAIEAEETEAKKQAQFKLTDEYWNYREPFLTLNTSKTAVYVKERLHVSLLFCIPEGSKTSLKFYELGEQLSEIIKKIKPENCTQQTITIDSVQQGSLVKNGKKITYFKLYETYFYPINNKEISFSALNLKMLNKKSNTDDSKNNLINYTSKQLTIDVKKLPFHPLRDLVAVGNFKLEEKISTMKFKTGRSFNYIFSIVGTGDINQLAKPNWLSSPNFEFFDPEIIKSNSQVDGELIGKCSFNSFVIPHEPGNFNLGKFFNYIYFNVEKQTYDTLKSQLQIQVLGESKHNFGVSLNSGDDFYDLIKSENNFFVNNSNKSVYILLAKIFIGILIFLLFVLIFRR